MIRLCVWIALAWPAMAVADVMSITVQSTHSEPVQFELFVEGTDQTIPAGQEVWELNNPIPRTFGFECTRTQRLCIGAWQTGAPHEEWGVGYHGDRICPFCCFTCNGFAEVPPVQLMDLVRH